MMAFSVLKISLWCTICTRLFVLTNQLAISTTEDEIQNEDDVLIVRLSSSHGDRASQVVMKKGKSVQLICEFPAKPWSFIQWERYNAGDSHSSFIETSRTIANRSDNVYTSIDLAKVTGEDSGNYSCVSRSSFGEISLDFYVAVRDEGKLYCDDVLCQPNGTCQELLNGYKCRCFPGFIGNSCGMVDPCVENPCHNNGTCEVIDEDNFNCTCIQGFAGSTCIREVCTSSTCNNGGSCLVTESGKTQCKCTYRHVGTRCEHTCTFRSSLVGYRYRDYGQSMTCIIDERGNERCLYERRRNSGNRCILQSDVRNECQEPNICSGRGSCTEKTYKYQCSCNSYASGTNCEFYNECSANYRSCRYGGSCVDLVQGFKCSNCPKGQTGDKCQYNEKPCVVECRESYMVAKCDMRFLPSSVRVAPIYLNSKARDCVFNGRNSGTFGLVSKRVYYSQCGTKIQYDDDYVVFRNSISAGTFNATEEPNDLISRISGHFRFDMKCKLELQLNETTKYISDKSMDRNISLDFHDEHEFEFQTYVTFYNNFWRQMTDYIVGDRLYVELMLRDTVSNHILSDHGILYATTCYATPDEEGKKLRYVLLENGCIKDKTFRFEKSVSRTQKHRVHFSFQSFYFKRNELDNGSQYESSSTPRMYLHCKARFCLDDLEEENNGLTKCSHTCEDEVEPDFNSSNTTVAPKA